MHIVLVNPEIPQNTGNIARTCAATGLTLHLVKPLGFQLDDKYMKRAGLDYWFLADVRVHESWQDFLRDNSQANCYYATTRAPRDYCQVTYGPEDYLVFGRESRGLDEELLAAHYERCIRIPMRQEARSLNLSNSVAIVAYEALRQQEFPGLTGEGSLRQTQPRPGWRDYL